MKKDITLIIETDEFFNEVGAEETIRHLESKGYGIIKPGETSKYINLDMSVGGEPFYKLLAEFIEKGKLSLEMIIGHVVTKKIMDSTPQVNSKE